MARNGKMNDFLKLVNKMELGNKYLSATKLVDGVDGKKIWAQVQTLIIKTLLPNLRLGE